MTAESKETMVNIQYLDVGEIAMKASVTQRTKHDMDAYPANLILFCWRIFAVRWHKLQFCGSDCFYKKELTIMVIPIWVCRYERYFCFAGSLEGKGTGYVKKDINWIIEGSTSIFWVMTIICSGKVIILNCGKWSTETHLGFCHTSVMRSTIWYHLYNSKNVKNTHGGVLILVKLQASACNVFKLVQMVLNHATQHI